MGIYFDSHPKAWFRFTKEVFENCREDVARLVPCFIFVLKVTMEAKTLILASDFIALVR